MQTHNKSANVASASNMTKVYLRTVSMTIVMKVLCYLEGDSTDSNWWAMDYSANVDPDEQWI